jgi:Spy/CpxP family protein refolding chaperone
MSGKLHSFIWMATILLAFGLQALGQDPASQAGQAAAQAASQAGQAASQVGQEAQSATSSAEASPEVTERLEKLSSGLNLTDDQKEKIKPILQGEVDKLQALRGDSSISDEQKESQAKQIHESAHSQIQSVLTPEQEQKLEQMDNSSDMQK